MERQIITNPIMKVKF